MHLHKGKTSWFGSQNRHKLPVCGGTARASASPSQAAEGEKGDVGLVLISLDPVGAKMCQSPQQFQDQLSYSGLTSSSVTGDLTQLCALRLLIYITCLTELDPFQQVKPHAQSFSFPMKSLISALEPWDSGQGTCLAHDRIVFISRTLYGPLRTSRSDP